MEIQYNGLKLVKDGTIICENNREIHFILNEETRIIIQFKNDPKRKEQYLENIVDKNDNRILRLVFFNFNNKFGSGYNEPTLVGEIDDVEYYLHTAIYTIGDDNNLKVLNYNWFTKEIKNVNE
jgi:hypothetical protein